jgi:dolichol-phosphate mannosyltransferase
LLKRARRPACDKFGAPETEMSKTLVIVPTYNERENLPVMAQCLLKLPVPVDLLVVDDNSPDGTGRIADDLAAQHPAIHVLHRQE